MPDIWKTVQDSLIITVKQNVWCQGGIYTPKNFTAIKFKIAIVIIYCNNGLYLARRAR